MEWKDYIADMFVDSELDGRYSLFVERNQCSEREYHCRTALRRMGIRYHRHVRCASVEGHGGRVLLNPLQRYRRRAFLAFGCGFYALDTLGKQAS